MCVYHIYHTITLSLTFVAHLHHYYVSWHVNSVTPVYDFVDDLGLYFDNDLITLFVEFAFEYETAVCINRYGYYLDFTLMHVCHSEALLPVSVAPCICHA